MDYLGCRNQCSRGVICPTYKIDFFGHDASFTAYARRRQMRSATNGRFNLNARLPR